MGDGRTPTLIITGTAGSVTLEDIKSSWPFAELSVEREYQMRRLRAGVVLVVKKNPVWRLPWQATLPRADMELLMAISEADPPSVTVSYERRSWTGGFFDFKFAADPDAENEGAGPLEYKVSGLFVLVDTDGD